MFALKLTMFIAASVASGIAAVAVQPFIAGGMAVAAILASITLLSE